MTNSLFSEWVASAVLCALVVLFPTGESAQARERAVYSFCGQANCADGEHPMAGLIDVNGTLYGTTYEGGAHGGGAVFAVNPKTGAEAVVYSFCSLGGCADGEFPSASLIDVDGTLYGTTFEGGSSTNGRNCYGGNYGCGIVFSLNLSTGVQSVLYSFCSQANCSDGASPENSLLDVNGTLYGTTDYGGANCQSNVDSGCGTAFMLDPNTGTETVLYSFCSQTNCTDGDRPSSSLVDVKGTLYGTTSAGGSSVNSADCYGANGCGTVFSLDPRTGAETVLYSFCSQTNCTDGNQPYSSLVDVKGTLYGTTSGGGTCSGGPFPCGTVFSLDPKTGAETVLHSFCSLSRCGDGSIPTGGLIDVRGTLYGTTEYGGIYAYPLGGTVFSLDISTGTETVLYAFCSRGTCRDGTIPNSGLLQEQDRLYGTTSSGGRGRSSPGVLFWVKRP